MRTLYPQALFNERLAPEVMAYEGELVERVRERIEQQVGAHAYAYACECV